jgi:hypothetical protein
VDKDTSRRFKIDMEKRDPDAIVSDRCDFALAIVKGLVEHDNPYTYFGSLTGFQGHEADGIRRGLLCRGPRKSTEGDGEYIGTLLTDAGRQAYHAARLHLLPNTTRDRACAWNWSLEARGF